MVGILRRLFGSKSESSAEDASSHEEVSSAKPVRRLVHPKELQVNDIVRFRFMDLEELSGKRFQVSKISTYYFGEYYPTFSLLGEDGQNYFLAVATEEGGEFLTITKPIKRVDVGRIFQLEAFANLFEEKEGTFSLERKEEPQYLLGWTSKEYFLSVDALKGTFYKNDMRLRQTPVPSDGEGLDYYMLMDGEEKRTLEVEVYDGGQTEVALGLRLPIDYIAELWPGS